MSQARQFTMTFQNQADLFVFAKNCLVPFHIDGRKPLDTEKWILSRYLLPLCETELLKLPLTAIHSPEYQSPDFLLYDRDEKHIGLEITEASTAEFHREMINVERGINTFYEFSLGSTGDEQERLWEPLMLDAIQRKSAKLFSGSWLHADAYDLVIL